MDRPTLKINVFYCANSFNGEDVLRFRAMLQEDTFKEIRLPCSGKVDIPYLVKAFEAGADGLVIVTCKQDECRHLEGNMRAHRRAQAVDSLLDEIGLGPGRITVVQLTDTGVEQVIKDIEEFCTRVRSMPQSYRERPTLPNTSDDATSPVHDPQETAL
jgi:coenzyme F420-reducing hydrogenase delta subunit